MSVPRQKRGFEAPTPGFATVHYYFFSESLQPAECSGLVVACPKSESHRGRFVCLSQNNCYVHHWARAAHPSAVSRLTQPPTLRGMVK